MTKNMYQLSKKKYGKCPYDNETLAVMIRSGDESAVRWLLSQEEGYLESIVYKICGETQARIYGDDLKQIGALTLVEAAKRFDPDRGVKLTTYAYTAVRDKMLSMFYELSAPAKCISFASYRFSDPAKNMRVKRSFCQQYRNV